VGAPPPPPPVSCISARVDAVVADRDCETVCVMSVVGCEEGLTLV